MGGIWGWGWPFLESYSPQRHRGHGEKTKNLCVSVVNEYGFCVKNKGR